jgi:distribution and morphology protein 12
MSIDLDWSQLDAELTLRCLQAVNVSLGSIGKPAFLGEIVATSLSFGNVAPQLELVEIRDVFEEFLHLEYDDNNDDDGLSMSAAASSVVAATAAPLAPLFSPTSSLNGFPRPALGGTSLFSTPHGGLFMHGSGPASTVPSGSTTPGYPFPRNFQYHHQIDMDRRSNTSSSAINNKGRGGNNGTLRPRDISPSVAGGALPDPSSGVSLQLHFVVKYTGNMHMALETSIQVNYPSPSFMSLPLNLKVKGLAFEGIFVVAYEGDRKRLHVCIMDADRTQRTTGDQLLRQATVESEIGHMDKLVLKDMEKIEVFIIDAARKTLQVSYMSSSDYSV